MRSSSLFSTLYWALTAVVGYAHERGRPPDQAAHDAQAAALGLVRHPVVHDAHLRAPAACNPEHNPSKRFCE